jgi:pyruvate,water dikinase
LFQERAPAGFKGGFQALSRRYGLPIDYLDVRFVNDHCYARMRAVGAPEPKLGKPASPPPARVLWLLSRLHPELRRRAKTAKASLAERRWHADLARWEDELRDDMLTTGRALQAEDLTVLSDEELIGHVGRVADHMERGWTLHFDLLAVHNIPLGLFVMACRTWGIADRDALALLAGSSPASNISAGQLARVAAACQAAGVDPTSLDDVRAASPEASAALDAYLADHAWRVVTQYTPRGQALIELPHLLVQAIRAAGASTEERPAPDAAPLRARVPEADRVRFDDLLADARRCYGTRDDNVALCSIWPVGLLRRAILEAGRRLTERGVLEADWAALALGEQELAAALRGDTTMGALAKERVEHGIAAEAAGAPKTLGPPEGGPPDLSGFPAAMSEITMATLAFVLGGGPPDSAPGEWSGKGIGVSGETYTGRACVAASPEDALSRLEDGDVLVTSMTTPAYEAILSIAGAVVTEQGGLTSHTALVTRELGLTAVVGVRDATEAIPDGATVEVDPVAGQVRIVAAQP